MQMCLYTVRRAKHAGRLIVSHVHVHACARTHTYIDTVLVRRLLSLNNGAFFTIGDIFPFNTVNAAMPQIGDYCSLTDTKKTNKTEKCNDMLTRTTSMCFWFQTPALSVGRIRVIITDWNRNRCLCIQQMEPLAAVTPSCTSVSDLL